MILRQRTLSDCRTGSGDVTSLRSPLLRLWGCVSSAIPMAIVTPITPTMEG